MDRALGAAAADIAEHGTVGARGEGRPDLACRVAACGGIAVVPAAQQLCRQVAHGSPPQQWVYSG
ncbi:hypothetical protein [Streptomyces atratus]|uniref:hypothetical protein n=1 Tax=Streptomyces atratus TaxID=1893 RepID=UPI0016703996|nr:hypothetical protein [Streptomyces atratus]